MTTMNKKVAARLLTSLDETGNLLEQLVRDGKLDPKSASEIITHIDSTADRIQVAAFGKDSFDAHVAKVLKSEPDEPYMKTFENPQKPIKTDPDEPYMHSAEGGYTSDSIPTFDSDDTSQVTDRKEHAVRDLSEWADKTTQQPSWNSGPAGPSTKAGSSRRASAEKTWAP